MDYSALTKVYEELENTTKGLEKTTILAEFLKNIKEKTEYIYLLQGSVYADYDSRELGISHQLAIRAIGKAAGIHDDEVIKQFKALGELGKAAEHLLSKNKQQTALFSKKLTVDKVLTNLRKLSSIEGKGTVETKIGLLVDLLHSAKPTEAKYLIRTVLGDLKVGVGSGLIRDAIVEQCYKPKTIEEKKEHANKIQEAYDKATDFAEVYEKAQKNKLQDIKLQPGKPVKVMLFPKAHNIKEAFRIIGTPAAFEYKYDGFRVMINKDEQGKIKIFTRRLEDVTTQFPDIKEYAEKNIKAKSYMIDAEAVGYNAQTKKYTAFQDISQRIRRKYGIKHMAKNLPVELVIFDIIYYNGKSTIETPFKKRRKLLENIIQQKPYHLILAKQIITEKEKEVQAFHEKALKEKQEGLMGKNLEAPYKPGARIGHAVKIKPEDKDFDLVITGAEWGTGKRAGWLTSFDVACQDEQGNLLTIGKVGTGLKEKPNDANDDKEGNKNLTFEELTKKLKKIITKENGRLIKVKPKIVVTIQYQNIQKSTNYNSGYALRFPRITRLREDRGTYDIARLEEIEKEAS